MSLWQEFVGGFRRGITQGPTVLSIARVDVARRLGEVEVTFDLRVDNWHGDAVQLEIDVVDANTRAAVASVKYQIKPDWPCWNVTIPNVTYKVTGVPAEARCYAQLTLREDGNVLASWTTPPIDPSRSTTVSDQSERARAQSRDRKERGRAAGESSSRTRGRLPASGPIASREEKMLGLVPGYDALTLKAAYRRALSRWHPDRFARSSQARRDVATERTVRIIEAFATLSARLAASAQ